MDKIIKHNNNGVVDYKVVQQEDETKIVKRIYPVEVFNDPVLLARFKERVAVLNEKKFEGIPDFTLEIRNDGKIFLLRDYFEGTPLEHLLQTKKFSNSEATEMILKISEIIKNLHEEGIIFGNLSPKSIIINDKGEITLINIRLLETLPENFSFTEEYFTYLAKYMSPEVAMGDLAGKSSDIYALGIIYYQLIHGYTPYEHKDPVMIAWGHVNSIPEFQYGDSKTKNLIELMLRKTIEERLSDVIGIVNYIKGDRKKLPELPHDSQDQIKEHYFSYLKNKYMSSHDGSKFSMNAILVSMLILLAFMLPLVWMIDTNEGSIEYSINEQILFNDSFNHYFAPKLKTLPEVKDIVLNNGKAEINLSLEPDKGFLEKIQKIFSSNLLPVCKLDLSLQKKIIISFSEKEKNKQINLAIATLSQKIHSRLRQENIVEYNLNAINGNLILRIPQNLENPSRENLFSQKHISLHLLTGTRGQITEDSTSEILIKNKVEERFKNLSLFNSANITKSLPTAPESQTIFWNLLGTMNLHNTPHYRSNLSSDIQIIFGPIPELNLDFTMDKLISNAEFLTVSKESICSEDIFFNGRIQLTENKKFIFQLGNSFPDKKDIGNYSKLPYILAIDNKARAIIYNPDGLDPEKSIVYGFKTNPDLFDFSTMIQSALPAYVEIR